MKILNIFCCLITVQYHFCRYVFKNENQMLSNNHLLLLLFMYYYIACSFSCLNNLFIECLMILSPILSLFCCLKMNF